MKWSLPLAAILGLASTLLAPPVNDRSYAGSNCVLVLDGKNIPIRSFSGGEPFADLARTPGATARVVGVRYEPIIIEVDLSADQALWNWVSELLSGQSSRRSGSILMASHDYRVVEELRFKDALLTEVIFPAFDGTANKEVGKFRLKLAPASTQTVAGNDQKLDMNLAAKQKAWMAGSFRVEIDGLDCGFVAKIENIAAISKVAQEQRGSARTPERTPAQVELSDLRITVSAAKADSFRKWAESIVAGKADERNGTIVMLDSSLKNEVGRVYLKGLGITRLARSASEGGSDQVARLVATAYVRELSIKPGQSGAATPEPAKTTDPAPTPKRPTPIRRPQG